MERKYMNVSFDEIDLKEDGDEAGVFTGYGSTFGGKPDSYGDIVVAGAFRNTLAKGGRNGNGVAMLWQHEMHNPIGIWEELAEDEKGLRVRGRLAVKATQGKDAFELMKIKALKGLSIGYNVIVREVDEKKKVTYLKELELWEISPVTFPANIRATITNVKNAVENANTPRELEEALRDEGISAKAAMYLVSLCKDGLFNEERKDSGLGKILESLKSMKSEIGSIKI